MLIFFGRDEVVPKSNFRIATVSLEIAGTRTLSGVVVPTFRYFLAGVTFLVFPYWLPWYLRNFRFGFLIRREGDGVGVENVKNSKDLEREGVIGVPTLDWLFCEQLCSGGVSCLSLLDGGT